MKPLRVMLVLGVALVVSLIAGAYAAGRELPPMTAAQAREFTVRAFTYASSGEGDVEVTGEPREEVFNQEAEEEEAGNDSPGPGGDAIDVWVVPAMVANQPVELYVARRGDRAVKLTDALAAGGFVLNEEQFDRLAEFRLNPSGEEQRQERQGPAVAAGVLVVGVSFLFMVVVVRGRRSGSSGPGGGGTSNRSERRKTKRTKDQDPPVANPAPAPAPTPAAPGPPPASG